MKSVTAGWRRFASLLTAGLLIVAAAGVVAACGGGGGSSIEQHNADAATAVAYKSGADFVKALKQAGVLCPAASVSAVEASGVHVADSVSCTYAKDDYFSATVAWPSTLSSKYFSIYFPASQKACRDTGCKAVTLKGNLWFAGGAPDEQRLYEVQDALGGQLSVGGKP